MALPVIADESLCNEEDAQRLIDLEACQIFNLRLSKCGGLGTADPHQADGREGRGAMPVGVPRGRDQHPLGRRSPVCLNRAATWSMWRALSPLTFWSGIWCAAGCL